MNENSFEKFRRIFSFVVNAGAPFYRNKYRQAGFSSISLDRVEDVRHIPLLHRSELAHCPVGQRHYMPWQETLFAGYTSGTTSGDLFPLLRNYNIGEPPDIEMYKVLLLPVQPWRVIAYAETFRKKKAFVVCGDMHNMEVTASMAQIFAVDTIYATPASILLLVPYLQKYRALASVRSLILHGEPLSNARRESIQRTFPHAAIHIQYGLSEIGNVSSSCPGDQSGALFHLDEHFWYETVDAETGEAVPLGKQGELILTTLEYVPTPLIRYRTGDLAVLVSECSCNKKTRAFVLLGRIGFDVIKIGGFEFRAAAFEKGIEGIPDLAEPNIFEVHLYEERAESDGSVKPRIRFRIGTVRSLTEEKKRSIQGDVLQRTIVGRMLSLEEAVQRGLLLPPQFEFATIAPDTSISRKRGILINHI